MNILAIDTSGEFFSVAVQAGERVFAVHKKFPKPHDEVLLPQIEVLLKKAKLSTARLDAVAVASGPGRFTGIRVGMAYATVAARCLGKPALAITRFDAAAHGRTEPRFCVALPGFRDEIFYQLFKRGKPQAPPVWAQELPAQDVPIVRADPCARDLLGPAARLLESGRVPKFEPLYLKPAGYERKAGQSR